MQPILSTNSMGKKPCSVDDVEELMCLNGGSCFIVIQDNNNDSYHRPECSCPSPWTGKYCQIQSIDPILKAFEETSLRQASFAALIAVGLLLVIAAALATFVYIRYRRKERRLADQMFTATAEELYRRPFNGRSSIVESLSRISSLRRAAANDNKYESSAEKAELCVPKEDSQSLGENLKYSVNADDNESNTGNKELKMETLKV